MLIYEVPYPTNKGELWVHADLMSHEHMQKVGIKCFTQIHSPSFKSELLIQSLCLVHAHRWRKPEKTTNGQERGMSEPRCEHSTPQFLLLQPF